MRATWIAVAALVLALLPRAVLAHGGTELSVRGEVRPDGPIELVGDEFAPNDVVRVELRKEDGDPVELGSVPTDEEGVFSAALHVPAPGGTCGYADCLWPFNKTIRCSRGGP